MSLLPPKVTVAVSGANDSSNVLQLAQEAIVNNHPEKLSKYLGIIPLEQLDVKNTDNFFSIFMGLCAANNRIECMKIVFTAWDRVYPPNQQPPIFSKLFLMPVFDVGTLAFLAKVMEENTYLEVMDDIVHYDSSPVVGQACERALLVYGEQPYETYKFLHEMASSYENNNDEVANFMMEKIRQSGPFAPVPKWMADFRKVPSGAVSRPLPLEIDVKIPTHPTGGFEIPNLEDTVELLTEGLEQSGISLADREEAKRHLTMLISAATTAEKIEILKPVFKMKVNANLQDEDDLFRVLGPTNPLVESSMEEMEYGGCRMFTCSVFDYDEESEQVVDWFEGFCHACNKRIRRRWHAVRMPRPHGGWKGAFCSWDCVRDKIDDPSFNPEGEPDLLTHMLVNEFEVQINIIGIQDRISGSSKEKEEVSEAITSTVINPSDLENEPDLDKAKIEITRNEFPSYPLETGYETYGGTRSPTNENYNLDKVFTYVGTEPTKTEAKVSEGKIEIETPAMEPVMEPVEEVKIVVEPETLRPLSGFTSPKTSPRSPRRIISI